MSVTDDTLVAWLTARIDQAEREAPHAHERGCFAWDDYHYRHGTTDEPSPGDACECGGPLRAMARVEAERAILAEHADQHECTDGIGSTQWPTEPCRTTRLLAWGHRHDAPGFLDEWAPCDAWTVAP